MARKTIAFVDIFGGSWILLIRFDYELRSEHRQRMVRRQDISALLLYCLGYSRIRNLIFRLQLKPVTRMVIFHNIFSEASSNFKANLFFLKQRTNVVGLDEYFSGRLSFNKVNVVITFDDGYKSWLTHAIPALKELGLSATFFVTSGSVGLSKEKEADFMQSNLRLRPDARTISEGLSVSDVKKIVKEGFTLGGHTLNHGHLGEIGDSSLIRAEIIEDKSSLEKMGGIKIEYFAYPFGSDNNPKVDLVELLKEVGYKGAVTIRSGFNTLTSNPYLLHRDITDASMPGRVFRARVYGNYDGVNFIKKQISKIRRIWGA